MVFLSVVASSINLTLIIDMGIWNVHTKLLFAVSMYQCIYGPSIYLIWDCNCPITSLLCIPWSAGRYLAIIGGLSSSIFCNLLLINILFVVRSGKFLITRLDHKSTIAVHATVLIPAAALVAILSWGTTEGQQLSSFLYYIFRVICALLNVLFCSLTLIWVRRIMPPSKQSKKIPAGPVVRVSDWLSRQSQSIGPLRVSLTQHQNNQRQTSTTIGVANTQPDGSTTVAMDVVQVDNTTTQDAGQPNRPSSTRSNTDRAIVDLCYRLIYYPLAQVCTKMCANAWGIYNTYHFNHLNAYDDDVTIDYPINLIVAITDSLTAVCFLWIFLLMQPNAFKHITQKWLGFGKGDESSPQTENDRVTSFFRTSFFATSRRISSIGVPGDFDLGSSQQAQLPQVSSQQQLDKIRASAAGGLDSVQNCSDVYFVEDEVENPVLPSRMSMISRDSSEGGGIMLSYSRRYSGSSQGTMGTCNTK